MWDKRKFDKPLVNEQFGNDHIVQKLHFDPELKMLYAYGRGSQDISVWQYSTEVDKLLYFLTNCFETNPTIGFSMMPKTCVNP